MVAETLPETAFWSILYAGSTWCDPRTWQDTELPTPEPRPVAFGELFQL